MLLVPSRSHLSCVQQDQRGCRILIIDRNPAIREMLTWMLHLSGYKPIALLPDQPLLTLWKEGTIYDPPQMILLDVSLLLLQEVIVHLAHLEHQWRDLFVDPLPPIVLLTTAPCQRQALEEMGYLVLIKPFHLPDLRRLIEIHIRNKHAKGETSEETI